MNGIANIVPKNFDILKNMKNMKMIAKIKVIAKYLNISFGYFSLKIYLIKS